MKSKSKDIIFIGSARDYHAMHRYRIVKEICSSRNVLFVTDSIEAEGFDKLINDGDRIIGLYNIDWLMFSKQTKYINIWRNLVKLLFMPLQVLRLKRISKNYPDSIFHAVPIYYMFLCWMARIPYVGTPQGSEILVRTHGWLYRFFAVKSILAARNVSVDSVNMQKRIIQLCGREVTVMQNGIDVSTISTFVKKTPAIREHVVSIRGFSSLYRIDEIFDGRSNCRQKPRLHFIYPLSENIYRNRVVRKMEDGDVDLGRLAKSKMYELLVSSKLAISIPMSDSSPRSVYESIFCGCCVAVTYNPWIDTIPECMKTRLFIVDLTDKLWLEKALVYAESVIRNPYVPSEEALNMFDEKKAMKMLVDKFY